jgi:hypothetical protein
MKSVSKTCGFIERGNLPCRVEEVVLYLRQETSALSALAMSMKIFKRVEM